MEIEPIGLHRGLYARLKQPRDLGGQLGRVTPVASGQCFERDLGAAGRLLDITWSDGTVLLLGLEPGARVEDPPHLRRLARATLPS